MFQWRSSLNDYWLGPKLKYLLTFTAFTIIYNFSNCYFFRYGWHQMVSYSWNIFTRPFWIQSFSMRWDVLHLKLCKKYRWSTYLLYSSVIFLKQLGTYMTSIFKNDTDSCFQLSMQRSWDSKYSNIIVIFSTILFKKKKYLCSGLYSI